MAPPGAGFVATAPADDVRAQDPPAKEAPTAFNAPEPAPVLNWGTGDSRSFLVPAYEIDSHQSVRTVSVGYTLLGHERFGAVDWRPDDAR